MTSFCANVHNSQWIATWSPALGKFLPSPAEIRSTVTPIVLAVEWIVRSDRSAGVGLRSVRSMYRWDRWGGGVREEVEQ